MLVIRKEPGYTSSDVVAKLRGILHMSRIGHTGTLDPMAEGVLPVCLGSATKLAEFIADRDKEYVARLRLGVTTDTQDLTGQVLMQRSDEEVRRILLGRLADAPESRGSAPAGAGLPDTDQRIYETIAAAAGRFTGEIQQIPPMYSAVWVDGQRLYALARKGVTVERQPRTVVISGLEILSVELPVVTMRVVCSKGTYIRTLCEDLGNALGTGGAMEHLLRTRVGQFTLGDALTLGQVQEIMDCAALGQQAAGGASEGVCGAQAAASSQAAEQGPAGRGRAIEDHIIPIDAFFADAPAVHVREEDVRFLQNGNALSAANTAEGQLPHAERIRVYDEQGGFWALYRYDRARRRIVPVRMFHETNSVKSDRK